MKDFVYKDKAKFLEISDNITTPFKFLEVEEIGNVIGVDAHVWLRTAYISYHEEFHVYGDKAEQVKKELEDLINEFKNHGFAEVEVRETAFPIK